MVRIARSKQESDKPGCDIYIGLDIMLRNTCICGLDIKGERILDETWDTDLKKIPRQDFYYAKFIELISRYPNASYGFEDYAYAKGIKNSRSTFSIGEVTGMFKLHVYRARLPGFIFGIGQIKKFFTGNGNADKNKMIESAREMVDWLPEIIQVKTKRTFFSHKVDAYAIALMVRYFISGGLSKLNKQQESWLEAHSVREFGI